MQASAQRPNAWGRERPSQNQSQNLSQSQPHHHPRQNQSQNLSQRLLGSPARQHQDWAEASQTQRVLSVQMVISGGHATKLNYVSALEPRWLSSGRRWKRRSEA